MNAPRRIVTAHDQGGRGFVVYDGPAPASHRIDDGTTYHDIWLTSTSPAPITATEQEPMSTDEILGPPANGTLARIVDMPPGIRAAMHRTETIDYGVVLEGAVTLVLDDGSVTTAGPGDLIVQRGTEHAWENRTDATTRILFVLVGARVTDELRPLIDPNREPGSA